MLKKIQPTYYFVPWGCLEFPKILNLDRDWCVPSRFMVLICDLFVILCNTICHRFLLHNSCNNTRYKLFIFGEERQKKLERFWKRNSPAKLYSFQVQVDTCMGKWPHSWMLPWFPMVICFCFHNHYNFWRRHLWLQALKGWVT